MPSKIMLCFGCGLVVVFGLCCSYAQCWGGSKCCGNKFDPSCQLLDFGRIPCFTSRCCCLKNRDPYVKTCGFLVDSPWFLNHIQGPEWEQTMHWEGFVDPLKWTSWRLSTLFRNVFFPSFVMSKWFEWRKNLGRTISCTCRSKVSQTEPTTRDFSTENPYWGTQTEAWTMESIGNDSYGTQ